MESTSATGQPWPSCNFEPCKILAQSIIKWVHENPIEAGVWFGLIYALFKLCGWIYDRWPKKAYLKNVEGKYLSFALSKYKEQLLLLRTGNPSGIVDVPSFPDTLTADSDTINLRASSQSSKKVSDELLDSENTSSDERTDDVNERAEGLMREGNIDEAIELLKRTLGENDSESNI